MESSRTEKSRKHFGKSKNTVDMWNQKDITESKKKTEVSLVNNKSFKKDKKPVS